MEKRNIIVIGASAGGIDAFKRLFAHLPADLDASIFVVWHMAPSVRGVLPNILSGITSIIASHAVNGEPVQRNHIYVAPPDQHMLVEDGHIHLSHGPKENRFRPAIDPLFRSAAASYGTRVIGVILSGALDDGMAGLWTIKERGGLALVQDPAEAEVPSMPKSAIQHVPVDFVLPAEQLANELVRLVGEEAPPSSVPGARKFEQTAFEIRTVAQTNPSTMNIVSFGELSPYTCPECHGVLTRLREGSLLRYRCHTGHAYSADTLLAAVTETIEDNLYSTLRSMDEAMLLLNHLGDHYAEANLTRLAAQYFQKAQDILKQAEQVKQIAAAQQILSQDILSNRVNGEPKA